MKTETKECIRALRKIIGLTQAEFAVMTGVSKDTVTSWETGRNQVSEAMARRIELVTGVDGRMLLQGVSVPFSKAMDGHCYTAEDFKEHQQAWGGSDEAGAQRHLEHCRDTMELLLLAAARAGGAERHRLPGLLDSFMQWCQSAREDFELGPQIDAELGKRAQPAGMTQTYRSWRAMARQDGETLRAAGFRDDPLKGDQEELRLELKLAPGWAPGRSMKWPKPAMMKAVG